MKEKIKNVAHPPSGAAGLDSDGSCDLAKPARSSYRRNLPHIQVFDKPIFVTFLTKNRWILPEQIRDIIIRHCLYDHGIKIHLHSVVVMPDHVHLIFTPLRDSYGNTYGIAEILNGIKGSSAHSINKTLQRKGPVWQKESFDHILRCDERLAEKVDYICKNPVRKKIVKIEKDYPWLWKNPQLQEQGI